MWSTMASCGRWYASEMSGLFLLCVGTMYLQRDFLPLNIAIFSSWIDHLVVIRNKCCSNMAWMISENLTKLLACGPKLLGLSYHHIWVTVFCIVNVTLLAREWCNILQVIYPSSVVSPKLAWEDVPGAHFYFSQNDWRKISVWSSQCHICKYNMHTLILWINSFRAQCPR